jgi:hypothetical protein
MEKLDVIRCLVISPQDVQAEREMIVRTIELWNAQIGKALRVLIHPVRWETHAIPALGAPPQALLNDQIVSECDCAVAVFWSRLGTPTEHAASGSMEEISVVLGRGGQVLVYKCSRDIPQGILNIEQLTALQREIDSLKTRGIVFEYAGNEQLQILLLGHLTGLVNALTHSKITSPSDKDYIHNNRSSDFEIVVKTTWGIPAGMGPNTKSLLCVEVQNHSEKPLYYSSMMIELSDGKTMVPQIDAFDRPLPNDCVINSGDSLGYYFDFADILETAKNAGASIKSVVAKDKIGREFRSSSEELEIAIANFTKWETI